MSDNRPTIRTNNVPRDILNDHELSDKEREEFDYHDWDKIDAGEDSASFFRYKGQVYDLGSFSLTDPAGNLRRMGWTGYSGDSYFSGTLVRYVDDNERVVVGRYYS